MRCLVACPDCRRQFDAMGLAAGSRFHCACGSVLSVPRFRPQDAEVVRCSSCGAPRQAGTLSCAHCGADYTLHDRDLQTICPGCMTRISDRARYCHQCGTPILSAGEPGRSTRRGCPACGRRHKLHSRQLGKPPVSVLECPRCAGLWLGHAEFELLRDAARDRAAAEERPRTVPRDAPAPRTGARGGVEPYRPCPECQTLMNRRNFGRRSGVIVDECREHGLWLDAHELERILLWIRGGGEAVAVARTQAEERHRTRLRRVELDHEARARGAPAGLDERDGGIEALLGGILGTLFGR